MRRRSQRTSSSRKHGSTTDCVYQKIWQPVIDCCQRHGCRKCGDPMLSSRTPKKSLFKISPSRTITSGYSKTKGFSTWSSTWLDPTLFFCRPLTIMNLLKPNQFPKRIKNKRKKKRQSSKWFHSKGFWSAP